MESEVKLEIKYKICADSFDDALNEGKNQLGDAKEDMFMDTFLRQFTANCKRD